MKTLRKIFALLMTMIMVFSMSATVFASGEGSEISETQTYPGNITIQNAQTSVNVGGTPTENTYTAYKIFDANPAGSGNDVTAPNTIWDGTVGYTVSAAAYNAYWENETQNLFVFTLAASGDYIVKLKNNVSAVDVSKYFSENKATMASNTTAFPSFSFTTTDGVTSANVPYGYYFVTSNNGSVVSVDTTNTNVVIVDKNTYGPPFSGTKEAVSVKGGQDATATDVANTAAPLSVAIGDTVGYEIAFETSNYKEAKDDSNKPYSQKISYVYVEDTLGGGMDYILNDNNVPALTVTIGEETLTGIIKTQEQYDELIAANAEGQSQPSANEQNSVKFYYVVYNTTTDSTTGVTSESFKIMIPWLYEDGNTVFADNSELKIAYSALVTKLVDEAEGTASSANAENTAELTYDVTNPDGTPETPEDGTQTEIDEVTEDLFIYALGIKKVDGSDLSSLAGAVFNIYVETEEIDSETNEKVYALVGAVLDSDNGSKTNGYYVYNSGNNATTPGFTTDFISDANGRIVLYGVEAGTYKAVEKTAPAGYNLLPDGVTLDPIVAGTTTTTTTVTTTHRFVRDDTNGTYKKNNDGSFSRIESGEEVIDKYSLTDSTENAENGRVVVDTLTDNTVSISVENNKGTELPSTGGIGTTIFYIVGTILVIGAGVVLISRKRMAAR